MLFALDRARFKLRVLLVFFPEIGVFPDLSTAFRTFWQEKTLKHLSELLKKRDPETNP